MEARVAPGQDLTGAAMATFLYDRLVAEEAGWAYNAQSKALTSAKWTLGSSL